MVLVRKRCPDVPLVLSVLALSSRFDGHYRQLLTRSLAGIFQYSLCRVVLMVSIQSGSSAARAGLSVLALSSRFDGPAQRKFCQSFSPLFQYSLCRVVLMVESCSWTR